MPRVVLRSDTRVASNPYPVDFLRADQFTFVLKASPYFLEAKRNGQLPVFLDSFFDLWFTMWADKPGDGTDFDTIHSRIQKIRETVIYNLAMTSVFHVEVELSWEEFRAEKLAEYLTRISTPLEHHANGRPRPRRFKLPKAKPAPPPPGTKFIVIDDSGDEKENHNETAALPAIALPAVARPIVLDAAKSIVLNAPGGAKEKDTKGKDKKKAVAPRVRYLALNTSKDNGGKGDGANDLLQVIKLD